jgi:hypothetical protein
VERPGQREVSKAVGRELKLPALLGPLHATRDQADDQLFGERVARRGKPWLDRLAVLALLRRLEEQVPRDLDDLPVDGDGTARWSTWWMVTATNSPQRRPLEAAALAINSSRSPCDPAAKGRPSLATSASEGISAGSTHGPTPPRH